MQLDRAASDGRTAELGALRTRFDVFWSRVERRCASAATARWSVGCPARSSLLDRLQATLQLDAAGIEAQPDPAAIASLRADLAGFETPLQELMLDLNQSSAGAHSTVLQRRARAALRGLAVARSACSAAPRS